MTDEHWEQHGYPAIADTYERISDAWRRDMSEDEAWLEVETRAYAARTFVDDISDEEDGA